MDYHTDLFNIFKQHKLKDALYMTGKLIHEEKVELLQRTWIRAIASIGDYSNVYYLKWYDTCSTLDEFIQSEQFNIKDAFLISTKICILFQNMIHYIVIPKRSVTQLRAKTISYFTDYAELSEAGINLFEGILPKAINEREFCLQVVSTLVSAWSSNNHIVIRDSIEYLCRKDYTIESSHLQDTSIVSFIWEFLSVFQPENTKAIYSIYKTDYKKKEKSWRISLLLGIHNCVNTSYNKLSWSDNDKHILQKTADVSKDMWAFIISSLNKTASILPPQSYREPRDKLSFFESYFPRVKESYDFTQDESLEDDEIDTIKYIYVSKKKLHL